MKRAIMILIFILAALLVGIFVLTERVPPQALTRTTLNLTEQRIYQYAAEYHRLPKALSDLPNLEKNRDSGFVDGWGRPIRYTKEGQKVTLLSLGRDSVPGGSGEDADIELTFTVSEASS